MLFPSWNLISLGMQAPFSMPAGSSSGVGFPRPQENTVYNIPTVVATEWLSSSSPLFCLTGVSSCPCCCQPVAWEAAQWLLVNFVRGGEKKEEERGAEDPTTHHLYPQPQSPPTPPSMTAPQLCSPSKTPPPLLLAKGSSQWWKILPMSSAVPRK